MTQSKYRILVNDFSGHPFQVQLSRWLAAQGHAVLHTYCSSFQTPHGSLTLRSSDPSSLGIEPFATDRPFRKYDLYSRWKQEVELGKKVIKKAEEFKPDIVLSANMPLGAQRLLCNWSAKGSCRFIFWLQDVFGYGIRTVLKSRLWWPGEMIGRVFEQLEKRMWRNSDHIITISDDFTQVVSQAGVPSDKITTIPNWAPLDELPVKNRNNPWRQKHQLDDKCCILYSGTLGFKHNPQLLVQLAESFRDNEEVRIVVNSEGKGADFLRHQKDQKNLDNLLLLGFQPFEDMPDVLATGDILVTLLEMEAGKFAVPSKVLSYLCARRALLMAVPETNLSARIVESVNAGLVVSPDDGDGFVEAAHRLVDSITLRKELADNGRAYANETFDIESIGKNFERAFELAMEKS